MARWLGFFWRSEAKDELPAPDLTEMDFWDFNRKRIPLVIGEVWKYIGRTTNHSRFMPEAKDWTNGENFDIVSIEGNQITIAGQYDRSPRIITRTFFDINFTHRTSLSLKESRQQTAGHVMTLIDGDTE